MNIKRYIKNYIKKVVTKLITEEYKKEVFKYCKRELWNEIEKIENKKITKKIKNGRIKCYLGDELSKLIFVGDFEEKEAKFVRSFLEGGGVFVDIGANIGLHTIIAASALRKKGTVISFEPVRKSYERLKENCDINKLQNVRSYRKGLSEEKGKKRIKTSQDGYDAWNTFSDPSAGEEYEKEEVEVTTLDDMAEKDPDIGNATLIKIDVEGWESAVIRGGQKLLSPDEAPVLLVEFTDQNTRPGETCQDLYELLRDLGYSLYEFGGAKKIRKHTPKEYYDYTNLIATKKFKLMKTRLGKEWKIV